MIHVQNLSFRYGRSRNLALDDVSLTLNTGLHLLVGENGAGKTTLLQLIAGMRYPQDGYCLLDGEDTSKKSVSTLRKIFYLPDNFEPFFASINQMAQRHAVFYPSFDAGQLVENLHAFNLSGNEPLKSLSLGMRRKSYIAYALALGVEVLLLDEPTNGLDIDSKKLLHHMISRCVSDSQLVIISTHSVDDLRTLYDGIIAMRGGKVIISETMSRITERLAFVCDSVPHISSIYQEPLGGMFRAIVPNTYGIDSDVDIELLFTALGDPAAREDIVKLLNSDSYGK